MWRLTTLFSRPPCSSTGTGLNVVPALVVTMYCAMPPFMLSTNLILDFTGPAYVLVPGSCRSLDGSLVSALAVEATL